MTAIEGSGSGSRPPLRAIVLDNDECIGSFISIFSLIQVLNKTYFGKRLTIKTLFDYLTKKYELFFRPGLIPFLRHVVELKKSERLDALISYTNQDGNFKFKMVSVPMIIVKILTTLVNPTGLFDAILARPPPNEQTLIQSTFIQKSFSRVLAKFPWADQTDISKIMFVDDNALPELISSPRHNDIVRTPKSWVRVFPYRKPLTRDEFTEFVKGLQELAEHRNEFKYPDDVVWEDDEWIIHSAAEPFNEHEPQQQPDIVFEDLLERLDEMYPLQGQTAGVRRAQTKTKSRARARAKARAKSRAKKTRRAHTKNWI